MHLLDKRCTSDLNFFVAQGNFNLLGILTSYSVVIKEISQKDKHPRTINAHLLFGSKFKNA